jgi:hypothetical protein
MTWKEHGTKYMAYTLIKSYAVSMYNYFSDEIGPLKQTVMLIAKQYL